MSLVGLFVFVGIFLLPEFAFAQADVKHPVKNLQHDFSIVRGALEESHAGIYWYRTKDEMSRYFDEGYRSINKDMTELEFYRILSPIIARVGCIACD